jgi:uncharacterized protein YndB with AHSA1/START domain
LIEVDGGPALLFERRYPQNIERVWKAVTDPGEMAQWFPSHVEGKRAEGAELAFVDDAQRAAAKEAGRPTRADGPIFRGSVIAFDPPNRFAFTWGGERLHFELTSDGDGTRLTFTHVLSHESVAARNGAGWHVCLQALGRLLGVDEEETNPFAVYDDYVGRVGPSLGFSSGDGTMTWERQPMLTLIGCVPLSPITNTSRNGQGKKWTPSRCNGTSSPPKWGLSID